MSDAELALGIVFGVLMAVLVGLWVAYEYRRNR